MNYNPIYWNMAGPHSGCAPMQQPQYYPQDDQAMEFGECWDQNLDPCLRGMAAVASHGWSGPPIQRYLGEPEKIYFTAPQAPLPTYSPDSYVYDFSNSCEAIEPMPFICDHQERLPSSPSQNSPSECSSEESPLVPSGYFQNGFQPQQLYGITAASSLLGANQTAPDPVWHNLSPERRESSSTGHVALSALQRFADQEDINTNLDEYMELDMKVEYPTEIKAKCYKSEMASPLLYPTQNEITVCVKDEYSPGPVKLEQEITSILDDEEDADKEGDFEQDESNYPEASEASDTEYKPRSTRTRKRTSRVLPSSPVSKRSKVQKLSKSSKAPVSCYSCPATFKDTTTLNKHTTATHARAYVCAFAFAGCTSDFASKNEWKRHVTSQHLNLHYWQCTQGQCGVTKPSATAKSNEFNRKDLFTQHLHRMHAPPAVKKLKKKTPKATKNPEWEARVRDLQAHAKRERRLPPTKARCPLPDCAEIFEGPTAWDARMEHVGRHLEQGSQVDQGDDAFLLAWAVRERIVERAVGARPWRFCGENAFVDESQGEAGGDADAEGEDE